MRLSSCPLVLLRLFLQWPSVGSLSEVSREHDQPLQFPLLIMGVVILKALFPNLTFVSALVITACLTPTDPVLSASICMGNFARKHVPLHIRELLLFVKVYLKFPV